MTLKILTLSEKREWRQYVEALNPKSQDIHYLPEYSEIYFKTYGYEPFCVYFKLHDQYLLQVFIKKRIKEYYDITNPYGYGGPIYSSNDNLTQQNLLTLYRKDFDIYCQREGIITEFTSLHPLLQNPDIFQHIPNIDVESKKMITYIDLTKSEADIWQGLSRREESNINKALKLGVSIEQVEATHDTLNEFKRIYYETMTRKGADKRWIFPNEYFANCVSLLGKGRVSFFFARIDSFLAAAYMLIHDNNICYYHFGGSDPAFSRYRATNLLMFKTILYAKQLGCSYYHLGGGVTSHMNDSLLRYKISFTKEQIPLYIYKVIHNRRIYKALLDASGIDNDNSYFPAYRRN